jgi:hypothetical protein
MKIESTTAQFAQFSDFVRIAFGDYVGDFWSAFSDEIDVSFGDATHTLVTKGTVNDAIKNMIDSEKSLANNSNYISSLRRITTLLIDAPDLIDLEN